MRMDLGHPAVHWRITFQPLCGSCLWVESAHEQVFANDLPVSEDSLSSMPRLMHSAKREVSAPRLHPVGFG
eukprot:9337392-Pyramimonas_sp.AAC.1